MVQLMEPGSTLQPPRIRLTASEHSHYTPAHWLIRRTKVPNQSNTAPHWPTPLSHRSQRSPSVNHTSLDGRRPTPSSGAAPPPKRLSR
jgi:hypothetical protein